MSKLRNYGALICATLSALLLDGASPHPTIGDTSSSISSSPAAGALMLRAKAVAIRGEFIAARLLYLQASEIARRDRDYGAEAMSLSNAGRCAISSMRFGEAMKDAVQARRVASKHHNLRPLLFAENVLANVYFLTGQPENSARISREVLGGPESKSDPITRAYVVIQLARSLAQLGRLDEAAPHMDEAVGVLAAKQKVAEAQNLLAEWGEHLLRAQQVASAAAVADKAVAFARADGMRLPATLLSLQAKISALRDKPTDAARLFDAALIARPSGAARWRLLSNRGHFRLSRGDLDGAMADFREARTLAAQVRADLAAVDQSRVAWEAGSSNFLAGLVDAGNRKALISHDPALLAETFDAAEQDRLWSLRSLRQTPDTWRSRLPNLYWTLLERHNAKQRAALAGTAAPEDEEAASLRLQLQELEATTAQEQAAEPEKEQAVHRLHSVLSPDEILFSFRLAESGTWLWVVDSRTIRVFPLPPLGEIRDQAEAFRKSLSPEAGQRLYSTLFGKVPHTLLRKTRWLLEPDGPLHDIAFPALVTGQKDGRPEFLIERAALQLVPGALLLERKAFQPTGRFVGIADPIYNVADSRYQGPKVKPDFSLPRLPHTSGELDACARVWGAENTRLLRGHEATREAFRKAAAAAPSVLHFATHVVGGTGDYGSGLIALSIPPQGGMELLGPREILASSVKADLVVMNGCHSAQAESLPNSGRMGLTRAWLGAGANSVLATQWDLDDRDAQLFITRFYTALRTSPERGVAAALREAQLASLRTNSSSVVQWAGYYLLSRTL